MSKMEKQYVWHFKKFNVNYEVAHRRWEKFLWFMENIGWRFIVYPALLWMEYKMFKMLINLPPCESLETMEIPIIVAALVGFGGAAIITLVINDIKGEI